MIFPPLHSPSCQQSIAWGLPKLEVVCLHFCLLHTFMLLVSRGIWQQQLVQREWETHEGTLSSACDKTKNLFRLLTHSGSAFVSSAYLLQATTDSARKHIDSNWFTVTTAPTLLKILILSVGLWLLTPSRSASWDSSCCPAASTATADHAWGAQGIQRPPSSLPVCSSSSREISTKNKYF